MPSIYLHLFRDGNGRAKSIKTFSNGSVAAKLALPELAILIDFLSTQIIHVRLISLQVFLSSIKNNVCDKTSNPIEKPHMTKR